MPSDIIVVVPPGTRVRYVESPYVDAVVVMDAAALEPKTFEFEPSDTHARLTSWPIYDAERYTPDA